MSGLWKRMENLFAANSHAAIDKLENPTHMSQQLLRELDQQLDGLRGQLVACLEQQRKLEQSTARLNKQCQLHQNRAHQALQTGDETNARHQLGLQLKLQQELEQLQQLQTKQNQWAACLREERSELLREREELSSQARLIQLRNDLGSHDAMPHQDNYRLSLQRRERMDRYSYQTHSALDQLLSAQQLRSEELGDKPRDDDAALDQAMAQLQLRVDEENAA